MKISTIIASSFLLCALGVAPAFAQTAQQDLEQYIKSHPELEQNPSLLNNPRYLADHPDLQHFLATHPNVDRQRYGFGAYDPQHQWRDEHWWHDHDPNWVAANHPEWNESHPGWNEAPPALAKDGAYDENHKWQSSQWWMKNHPNWVKEHHPVWAKEHGIGGPPPFAPHHHHAHPNG